MLEKKKRKVNYTLYYIYLLAFIKNIKLCCKWSKTFTYYFNIMCFSNWINSSTTCIGFFKS